MCASRPNSPEFRAMSRPGGARSAPDEGCTGVGPTGSATAYPGISPGQVPRMASVRAPDSLERRCPHRTPWPSPNIVPASGPDGLPAGGPGPRVARPGGQLHPGPSGGSTTCTPWPTTAAATTGSRRALPLNTTLDGHIDDLLDGDRRPDRGGGRPQLRRGRRPRGGAARRDADAGIVSVVAYEPPMPWLGIVGPQPQQQCGHVGWHRVGRCGAKGRGPDRGGSGDRWRGPPDHVGAAEAAERFFRRMVGDAAWDRLSESAKAERRADGPALRGRAGRHPDPPRHPSTSPP